MLHSRRIGLSSAVVLLAGGLFGAGQHHDLVETWPRLMFTAGCALAVILWVRPSAESDMIRKAEMLGYLDGLSHRAPVTYLDDRRSRDDRMERGDSAAGPHSIPDQG